MSGITIFMLFVYAICFGGGSLALIMYSLKKKND